MVAVAEMSLVFPDSRETVRVEVWRGFQTHHLLERASSQRAQ
jgi:hypothetical protein